MAAVIADLRSLSELNSIDVSGERSTRGGKGSRSASVTALSVRAHQAHSSPATLQDHGQIAR